MGYKSTQFLMDKDGVSTGEVIVTDTRDLDDAKRDALLRLSDEYNGRIEAGRNYGGRNFQIDADSQRNINGACSMAMVAAAAQQPFFQAWIATDNSTMDFDGQTILAFGVNIGAYVSTLVLNNRALKDAIAALDSIEACDKFDITQGWPAN